MSDQELTVEYIDEHRNHVHTFDSFGRAISDLILQSAKQQLINKSISGSNTEFKADVKVFPIAASGCVGVEVCVPLVGCSRVHVNVS